MATNLTTDYTTALNQWLARQRQSQQQYAGAAAPLQQNIQDFQPGGAFGRGQVAMLEADARRAGAAATAQQVASGMSSGSLATSTGLRINSDLSQAKLGVDDTRMQFLAQARQALSGLQGQQAGQTASTYDPYFNTYQGNKVQQRGQDLGYYSASANRNVQQQQLAAAKDQADRQYQIQTQQLKLAEKELAQKSSSTSTGGYKSLQF